MHPAPARLVASLSDSRGDGKQRPDAGCIRSLRESWDPEGRGMGSWGGEVGWECGKRDGVRNRGAGFRGRAVGANGARGWARGLRSRACSQDTGSAESTQERAPSKHRGRKWTASGGVGGEGWEREQGWSPPRCFGSLAFLTRLRSAGGKLASTSTPLGHRLRREIAVSETYFFPHERLEAYQSALRFYDHVLSLAGPHLRRGQTHYDQLVEAAESMLRNLAEGGCSFSPGTKSRFYRTAQGSTGECAGCLTIIGRKFPTLGPRLAKARGELELTSRITQGLIRRIDHCR